SVIDLIIDGDHQCVKHLFMGVYNVLWLFMQNFMIFTAEDKLDASVVERALELASIVFNESGDNFDAYNSSSSFNIFSFKLSCLLLLSPKNYIDINSDMHAELTRSLLVNLVIFTKSLGVDMNKIGKDKVSLKESISLGVLTLFIDLMSFVDDRGLFLCVIDTVCTRVVGGEVDGLLTLALIDYFISVESGVDLDDREEAYMQVVKYLKSAQDKGSIGVGLYDPWKELVMYPYISARIKDIQEKEHSANLLAASIIKEDERAKKMIEIERKHMLKHGAISRMLNTNICNVNNDGGDDSSCITDHADEVLSVTSEGQRYCDNEQNNRLIGLYKEILNKRFDEALEGLSNCERENREKLGGVDMLYAARINILKFECLVESVKHACPELKNLHCHYKRIASYLGMFKSAEVYGRLPTEVSAEQLQDVCAKFLPIITVLEENNSNLEVAVRYAKNAASIMLGMGEDEDTTSELELLLLQQNELKNKLVNVCETCQNIFGILGIRKEVLKKIRVQGTAGDVERKTIIIDVNNLLENCKMGIKNAMALEEKLSEIDK
ncbi:MAG: hypothetical protein QS748_14635, partial [Candidatus Endonucleobacter bathymodioli]|nr:hypothetical protein [Candidatus Endonucleobacter bathymodioli]